jgi:hypothetical protein
VPGGIHIVAYEYPTRGGVLRLLKIGCRWAIEFGTCRHGQWTSADEAVMAAARHSTGLPDWDRTRFIVSDDLLRWRPDRREPLIGEKNSVPNRARVSGHPVGWLTSDLVAGITLAAYVIPVSLAYATLAGPLPQVGVYRYFLGGLGDALAGSSRYLAVSPASAISLMLPGAVGIRRGMIRRCMPRSLQSPPSASAWPVWSHGCSGSACW